MSKLKTPQKLTKTFTGLTDTAYRSGQPEPKPGKISEFDEALSVLSDNISRLDLIISELGDRLARVMRSDSYESNEVYKSYETDLAKDVYSRALKVQELSENVYGYIRRLEI